MQQGFNSNVQHEGTDYHVQTEDWGLEKQMIVTRVFNGGAVLKTVRIPYGVLFETSQSVSAPALRLAMKRQHQEILDQVLSGQFTR